MSISNPSAVQISSGTVSDISEKRPTIMSGIMKSGRLDHVMSVHTGYQNAKSYYQRKLRRCTENWRFYWAHDPDLGLGQWPEAAVTYMLSQNRTLTQFNFVRVIVDTIAGGIMQMEFDPDFFPVNDEITSLTQAIKSAMYSDKELMDWQAVYMEMVQAGLIHEACIKMVRDTRYDSIGNIGFRNCLPGSVMADPYWKTWSSKDCKKCWHDTWHTLDELKSLIPDKADYIDYRASNPYKADEYGSFGGPTPYLNDTNNMWGSVHKLTTQYDIVEEMEKAEFAITDEYQNGVRIPKELDDADKPAWLNANHPTWDPMYVYEKPEKVQRQYMRAICPSISMDVPLQNGLTDIQIGRLTYFWWAASRVNGESSSIVDSIKDPQMLINYWESLMINKLQIEGGGGAQFADEKLFASNTDFVDYVNNRNNPAKVFKVKPGTLEKGQTPAKPIYTSGFPQEAYQMINHMVEVILPRISKATATKMGISEDPNTSGKLYEMMKIQSDQQVYTIMYGLRVFWNDVYEAYFMYATDLYARGGVERKFAVNKGKQKIVLNEKVYDEYGNLTGIKNDVNALKEIRHKVIVGDKPSSPTEKHEKIQKIGDFVQKLGASAPLVTLELIKRTIPMMMDMDAEDQHILDVLADVDMTKAITQSEMMIAQAKLQKLQAEASALQTIDQIEQMKQAKMQQLQAGMQGQPGAVGAQPISPEQQGQQGQIPIQPQEQPQATSGGQVPIQPAPPAPAPIGA